jgi:hypothetical protein
VGINPDVHFSPSQAKIGVMAFGFGHRADAIHKIQASFEIGEGESFREVVLLNDYPIRELFGVG